MRIGRRGFIGLDIGKRTVGAVQLSRPVGARGWRLEAATVLTRPPAGLWPTGEEVSEVAATLDRQGFAGNRVVVAVPESMKFSATLELPPRSSGAPIEELARQELARSAKRDAGQMEVGSWDVPAPPRSAGGGESTHLLAVGLQHKDAESLIEGLEGGGFSVEALECRCCAMVRSCGPILGEAAGQVCAIVDVAEEATSIAVIHSGTVAYDRPVIETGLERLRELVQQELRIEPQATEYLIGALTASEHGELPLPEESLQPTMKIVEDYLTTVIQELRSVMAYAIHRYPGQIGPVLLVGPGAALRGLKERIRTELDLETRVVVPRDLVEVAALAELERVAENPGLTTALGMAMRGAAVSVAGRGTATGMRRHAA
jgi:Tfp pilus assembly PilM family ATPase